ncbi:MAG: hypothetical protein DI582_00205 [Azospirillum brasilense]|nr:MAG: hypothetical protein DI582_00205 [Azospirillum brasilense]
MVASSVLHSPYVLLKKTPNTLLSLAIGIGAICWGSISRKNELQRDFDRAVGMRDAEINTLKASVAAPQPAPAPSYKDSVTAEESAQLAAKQERQHRMTDAVAAQPAPEATYQRA